MEFVHNVPSLWVALKSLASLSIVNVVVAIVVSLPIYYFWGLSGVLPALVLCTLLWAVAALAYGIKAHPFSFFTKSRQLKGSSIILGIGITFVVCEIIDHIAKLSVQSYLNNIASLEMVGLYNACRTMTLTYAGMVFSAMDQDYFPRLSGVVKNMIDRTVILTKQLDVTLMIITPMLVAFIVVMPIIVPLLLSGEFSSIIPMAQIIAASLIFRAIYLPNAYLPLAAGDSKVYFALNLIGALNTFWIILGYELGGLIGMGVAMFGENLIDVLMAMVISKWKYKISLPSKTKTMIIFGCLFMLATYSLCCLLKGWSYWVVGAILIALSILYSLKNYKEA
jgi:O-antigen/teichoic acid export membrane protein